MSHRMLLRNGLLLGLSPARVQRADLRIVDGSIAEIGPALIPSADDEVVDVAGAWITPGFVCAHTHLYSALSCGMPISGTPTSFANLLERIWWRLDTALDLESIEVSGLVGGLVALRAGITTVVDHHASPGCIEGSLGTLDGALQELGQRRVLCYELTDRSGPEGARAGLEEHRALLNRSAPEGYRATMIGAHASFTLTDDTLSAAAALAREAEVGLHIHASEAKDDVELVGESPVARLERLGALLPGTLLAHGVHFTDDDIARARDAGAWISHQPRSNMNNAVGHAPLERFPEQTLLGTDGIHDDMFAELQCGYFRAAEAGSGWGPQAWLDALSRNATFASRKLGTELGELKPNAAADLVVLDPSPGPPLRSSNLAAAFVFRLSAAQVRHVMVGGSWRLWDRMPTGVDAAALNTRAERVAEALWERIAAVDESWAYWRGDGTFR